jgi:hypothetical protein
MECVDRDANLARRKMIPTQTESDTPPTPSDRSAPMSNDTLVAPTESDSNDILKATVNWLGKEALASSVNERQPSRLRIMLRSNLAFGTVIVVLTGLVALAYFLYRVGDDLFRKGLGGPDLAFFLATTGAAAGVFAGYAIVKAMFFTSK